MVGLTVTVTLLVGCASEKSRFEMDYGKSFKFSKLNQTLNPEAEKNLEPVDGFDGQASHAVIKKRYRKSFGKPAKKPNNPLQCLGTTGK